MTMYLLCFVPPMQIKPRCGLGHQESGSYGARKENVGSSRRQAGASRGLPGMPVDAMTMQLVAKRHLPAQWLSLAAMIHAGNGTPGNPYQAVSSLSPSPSSRPQSPSPRPSPNCQLPLFSHYRAMPVSIPDARVLTYLGWHMPKVVGSGYIFFSDCLFFASGSISLSGWHSLALFLSPLPGFAPRLFVVIGEFVDNLPRKTGIPLPLRSSAPVSGRE
ncbi:hypothetical protein B0T19DRAFT_170314 [Cercophora scortea]|uniref:Uncharacterized protein n=1 Tax=Cercophora scortea TaxID=314031 RepID=A0AAE0IMD6_9PEZI|nr:hypothetical protein B0T19DRAFT_170314 [Cercophora scortea]